MSSLILYFFQDLVGKNWVLILRVLLDESVHAKPSKKWKKWNPKFLICFFFTPLIDNYNIRWFYELGRPAPNGSKDIWQKVFAFEFELRKWQFLVSSIKLVLHNLQDQILVHIWFLIWGIHIWHQKHTKI